MSQRRVTMGDVAAKAGVHVTTVSLALRNHPRLPEATRLRIQGLAERMGYRPDPVLRALIAYRARARARRTQPTLAYVTNWKTRFGWRRVTAHPEFFGGADMMAARLGYRLEHFWMREPGLSHERLSDVLVARGITGLIVASHGREMGDTLDLDWDRFCAVKIDYFPHRPVLHNVTNNQCDAIRVALQKAASLGYRRAGFVMHRGWDQAVDNLWMAGCLCEQQHMAPVERVPPHIFPGAEPAARWLNESDEPVEPDPGPFAAWLRAEKPDVIVSKGSFVLPLLRRLGLRVPRDVAFIDVFLERMDGTVAGVRQNHAEVGATAVEILEGQLQLNRLGIPEIPTTTFVDGTWFGGATCPARAGRRRPRTAPAVKTRA
ncbi:MAG TPA: LacI family DNA-binding transcriptional regulator [Opitutaceae bacterium]|jgi:LacI family transcriptional regulator